MGKEEIKSCVIIAASEIKDYKNLHKKIKSNSYIICADNGYKHCNALNIIPNLIIGDMDSILILPDNVETIKLSTEKDFSDTRNAVQEALTRGYTDFLLCGMLGGRIDHELANISLIAALATPDISAMIYDGVTEIYAVSEKSGGVIILSPRENSYFSVISMVDFCEGVTIEGAKYPLENYALSSLEARAISNEFIGKSVKISLEKGTIIIIITPKV